MSNKRPVSDMIKCANCVFWLDLDPFEEEIEKKQGRCHRYAPTVPAFLEEEKTLSCTIFWPYTDPNDWCGEFKCKHFEAKDDE